MPKQSDSIQTLTRVVNEFCEERDWDQFHNLKDLAIGASTEASELLECFRFKSEAEIETLVDEPQFTAKIADELADSFYFLLRLAHKSHIDLGQALLDKMEKNRLKYPAEIVRGKNKKYTEY